MVEDLGVFCLACWVLFAETVPVELRGLRLVVLRVLLAALLVYAETGVPTLVPLRVFIVVAAVLL